jgi:hypothetical protein
VSERCQSLFEVRRCLVERRAVACPSPGLLAVGHRLVPHLTPQRVQGKPFDLLCQALGRELLERLEDARVECPPALV